MVNITRRKVKGVTYYYLSYSYREDNKVKVIEKSLGSDKKNLKYENLQRFKEEFIREIFSKHWGVIIEDEKKIYQYTVEKYTKLIKEERLRDFGIEFTHNTNKIEGSTLTYRQTAIVIEHPDTPINKPISDINEAQLHMQCYEEMIATSEKLTLNIIQRWHKKLFSLHPDWREFAGKIRSHNVKVRGSHVVFPEPYLVKTLLDELFNWYNQNKKIIHPVLLSSLMHLRFVSIHPFRDGNGRMTRLLTNYILHKNKYPMFNISANLRLSYFKALERSNLKEDEMIFVGWFIKNYIKAINI